MHALDAQCGEDQREDSLAHFQFFNFNYKQHAREEVECFHLFKQFFTCNHKNIFLYFHYAEV